MKKTGDEKSRDTLWYNSFSRIEATAAWKSGCSRWNMQDVKPVQVFSVTAAD
jgi:exonuclease I